MLKLVCNDWEKLLVLSNAQTSVCDSMYHKESYKYVPPKEANKALVTNPKEMDIYKLPNKEFFKNLS